MKQTILYCQAGVFVSLCTVHGLKPEVIEIQFNQTRRIQCRLRIYQFEFVPAGEAQLSAGFWAHADPIHIAWRFKGAICFYRDLERPPVERGYQVIIELKQRLSAGDNHEFLAGFAQPQGVDRICQRIGVCETPAIGAIHPNKVGVAERADCISAIGFASGPQVAATHPAEYGGPAGLSPLSLQGVEDFFDCVSHGS